jgi:NDP-sugar pyrophosphorylase family protein
MKKHIVIKCPKDGSRGVGRGVEDLLTMIGGRSLIERTMDRVVKAGFDTVWVECLNPNAKLIKTLSGGVPWGIYAEVTLKASFPLRYKASEVEPAWTCPQDQMNDVQELLCDGGKNHDLLPSWPLRPGIWISHGVEIHPSAQLVPPLYLGENVTVSENCTIGPFACIEKNCFLDSEVQVRDVHIQEGAHCSRGLIFENMLINGAELYDLKRNVSLIVDSDIVEQI